MKVSLLLRLLLVAPFLCGTLDSAQALRTRELKNVQLNPEGSWKDWNKFFSLRIEMSIEQQLEFFKDQEKILIETIKNVPTELFNNALIHGLKDLALDFQPSKQISTKYCFLKNIDRSNQIISDFLWNTSVHSHKDFNDCDEGREDREKDCSDYLEACGSAVKVEDLKGIKCDADFVKNLLEKCSEKITHKKRNKNVAIKLEMFKDFLLLAKKLMDACEAKSGLKLSETVKPEKTIVKEEQTKRIRELAEPINPEELSKIEHDIPKRKRDKKNEEKKLIFFEKRNKIDHNTNIE